MVQEIKMLLYNNIVGRLKNVPKQLRKYHYLKGHVQLHEYMGSIFSSDEVSIGKVCKQDAPETDKKPRC